MIATICYASQLLITLVFIFTTICKKEKMDFTYKKLKHWFSNLPKVLLCRLQGEEWT